MNGFAGAGAARNNSAQSPPNPAKPQCTSAIDTGRQARALRHLVKVSAVRFGQTLAGKCSADQGEGYVEQHARKQHRHDQEGQLDVVQPTCHHRQDGEDEAAELAADIAHEDARTGEIERQETGQARGQQQRREIGKPAAVRGGNGGKEAGRDQRHTAGQAVQAVDEVHRIGGEQQPQHGHRRCHPADGERPDIGDAVVHHVNAAGDRDDSGHDLRRQLHGEFPVVHVVQEGHDGDRNRSLDDTDKVGVRQSGEFGEAVEHGNADQECHHHADAPALGRGPGVHLARVRAVQHARCDHPAHHGGGQQRQPDGEGQVA